jgi:hypothetical protein
MHDRIGAFHVRYRVPHQDPAAAAHVSTLDRALRAALPNALGARFALAFGSDPAVTVIRELDAPVTLDLADAVFDSRLVERVCRDTVDAVAMTLAKPPDSGNVVRFADEAEFAGAFIIDLLAGRAWERWYFGAFRVYRRTHIADTLRDLFASDDTDAGKVLAWLAHRDALEPVLELLGTDVAHSLLTAEAPSSPERRAATGVPALAAAGFELLRRWGLDLPAPAERERLLALFLDQQAASPDWGDRRALSNWLFEWIGFIRRNIDNSDSVVRRGDIDAIRSLLSDAFDWLDGPWLVARLERLLDVSEVPRPTGTAARRPGLTPGQLQELERLTESIAGGRLRVEAQMGADAVAVRLLIAAAEASSRAAPADRAVAVAIAEISGAYVALSGIIDASLLAYIIAQDSAPPIVVSRLSEDAARRLERVRAMGAAARALLHALLAATPAKRQAGDATAGAGLYLLTRVLEDVRVPALARAHEVPFAPLLAGLAAKWLGLEAPFDAASALWIGASMPDSASLDRSHEGLVSLGTTLFDRLVDQRTLDALPARASLERDAVGLAPLAGMRPATDLVLARIAVLLIRGWARWLPGLRNSSPEFLIEQCLRRRATALISEHAVELELESAALDVVVDMAGYFQPIEQVAWLGHRSIRFGRPSHSTGAPS